MQHPLTEIQQEQLQLFNTENMDFDDKIHLFNMSCKYGYLHIVKEILSTLTQNINTINFITPIQYAIKNGNIDVVVFLIDLINQHKILKPIIAGLIVDAINLNQLEIIKHLFKYASDKDFFQSIRGGSSIFHLLCLNGNLELIKYVFENTNTDLHNIIKLLPISNLAQHGYIDILNYFFDLFEKHDMKVTFECTSTVNPFSFASMSGQFDTLLLLFEKLRQYEIEINNTIIQSSFDNACTYGHITIVKFILKTANNANIIIDFHQMHDYTLLRTIYNSHLDIVQLLFEITNTANSPYSEKTLCNCFESACTSGNLALVKYIHNKIIESNIQSKLELSKIFLRTCNHQRDYQFAQQKKYDIEILHYLCSINSLFVIETKNDALIKWKILNPIDDFPTTELHIHTNLLQIDPNEINDDDNICPICDENVNLYKMPCSGNGCHTLCVNCIRKMHTNGKVTCPHCRTKVHLY